MNNMLLWVMVFGLWVVILLLHLEIQDQRKQIYILEAVDAATALAMREYNNVDKKLEEYMSKAHERIDDIVDTIK